MELSLNPIKQNFCEILSQYFFLNKKVFIIYFHQNEIQEFMNDF